MHKIKPPLYMIGKKVHCWRCDTKMPVIALLAPHIENGYDEVYTISGIEKMPVNIRSFIQSKVPTFFFRYSKTVGKKYFANTCPHCNVIYGDFFLHDEPGAPFFPADEEDAKLLYIKEIPINGPVEIEGGAVSGMGEIILEHAIRV
ncbi:hypothetical protein [Desulfobacula phenolica]|uniref:Uncharacterized protein n=1 Tax=Desulfobacula phenolica TaxID=90732 RepID=A0A1H2K584_9BACT|nr:hypothetical protein [Desulfobacula phenolica]SDU63860.1 hypothetical protein SAMN04487931_12112 [Desulfobacula phenolica]